MNIVCLNCEGVIKTEDPRKRFCSFVCRNRYNVRKSRSRPKEEVMSLEKLRGIINKIQDGTGAVKSLERKTQWSLPEKEWVDPI